MKKVTMQDIANMAGVSKTTVSIILNGKGEERKISKATRDKVLKIAAKLNFTPSVIARSLKSKKTNTIGLLVADISGNYFAKIGKLIEDLAWNRGYQVLFGSTDESEEKEEILINELVNRQVDGLIVASCNPDSKVIKNLVQSNMPLVLIDRAAEKLKVNSILVNNRIMMQKAIERLIRLGRRNIGLLSITPHIFTLKERIEGYKAALAKHHMPVNTKTIRTVDAKRLDESSFEELEILIDEGVDSIAFTNNQVAVQVINHLRANYNPLLSQLAFASFDDAEIFDFLPTSITCIEQPIQEIAGKSVDLLFNTMNGKTSPEKIVLEGKLLVR